MPFPIAAAIAGVSSFFGGLFGFKGKQADTIQSALSVVSDVTASNSQREHAIAQIIAGEAASESWLTRMWRPITALTFVGIIVAFWFGYAPPNLNAPLSPTLDRIFNIVEVCLYGYIPARTIDKIVTQVNLSKILRTFIEKKIL